MSFKHNESIAQKYVERRAIMVTMTRLKEYLDLAEKYGLSEREEREKKREREEREHLRQYELENGAAETGESRV